MDLKNFGYNLPEELIAQYPLMRRDQARLMVIDRKKGEIQHDIFANIQQYLPSESCIVLNDSKVIPARLLGRREKTLGRVEIFLLRALEDGYSYEVLMRPMKRLKVDECISIDGGKIIARIIDKEKKIVRFNRKNIFRYLNRVGHIPLPPYINRPDKAVDQKYYQTVYARKNGSVASPTAGLHFTKPLLNRFVKKGHKVEKVTLHVNYGTFKAVEEKDITRHNMHSEEYVMTKKVFAQVERTRREGGKIVAVGTTSCRVLETVVHDQELKGNTNIFIYPGCTFKMVDILITNFHLPYSTLLMLVHAFGTPKLMRRAYAEAIKQKYRFYSYGDAMLIL